MEIIRRFALQDLLLASGSWTLDLIFVLILVFGTALGAYRGFVLGVCKLGGRLFSLIFAVMFCVSFANFLELCFGMTTAITNGIANAYLGNEAYSTALAQDVAGANISEALSQLGVGAFSRWLISASYANVDVIPAGTQPAVLIASVFAKWIAIVIAFVALILLFRIGARLLGKLLTCVVDKFSPLRAVNQLLGAILGLLKSLIAVFLLLMLMNWLPIAGLHEFIGSSTIVGSIFTSGWFQSATSYAISGQWFSDYISKLIH